MSQRRRTRFWLFWAVVVAVVGGLAYMGVQRTRGIKAAEAASAADPSVPTTRVVRGSVGLDVYANGDLRAAQSTTLPAPAVGGSLHLLRLVETGTAVKAGDTLMEFDPTELQYQLEQSRSELQEAEQNVVKTRANADVQTSEEQVSLLTAQFDVKRAELDTAGDKELLPANEYAKRQIALDEAKHRLAQVESDVKAHVTTIRAGLTLVEESRMKARMAADRAELAIAGLIVKAPSDGLVAVKENRDASGGMFYSGMSLPEYRTGDDVFAGRPLVDILDITLMDVRAYINEQERVNVAVGQSATVSANGVPTATLTAKITAIGGQARQTGSGPLRVFEVTLKLDQSDPRLRPGTTVRLVMTGKKVDNVLHIPRQALFEKSGKSLVYVRNGAAFAPREVKVIHRTESRLVIEGLREGDEVALVDPERASTPASAAPKPPAPAPGGPK